MQWFMEGFRKIHGLLRTKNARANFSIHGFPGNIRIEAFNRIEYKNGVRLPRKVVVMCELLVTQAEFGELKDSART